MNNMLSQCLGIMLKVTGVNGYHNEAKNLPMLSLFIRVEFFNFAKLKYWRL